MLELERRTDLPGQVLLDRFHGLGFRPECRRWDLAPPGFGFIPDRSTHGARFIRGVRFFPSTVTPFTLVDPTFTVAERGGDSIRIGGRPVMYFGAGDWGTILCRSMHIILAPHITFPRRVLSTGMVTRGTTCRSF